VTKHQHSAEDRAGLRRRIEERCDRLGLTREDVAVRAGMAPRYLEYLTDTAPGFDRAGLVRVAAALGMTYRELTEGRADATPGQLAPVARPALVHLTEPECWERLGGHGVGRIALPEEPGPIVVPVNYLVDGASVVYRTEPGAVAAVPAGAHLSFQADHVDDRLRNGWSVLLVGTAERPGPDETGPLEQRAGADPMLGGRRRLWIRVRPVKVTGRRIGTVDADGRLV
jgi:hypothetical protein